MSISKFSREREFGNVDFNKLLEDFSEDDEFDQIIEAIIEEACIEFENVSQQATNCRFRKRDGTLRLRKRVNYDRSAKRAKSVFFWGHK